MKNLRLSRHAMMILLSVLLLVTNSFSKEESSNENSAGTRNLPKYLLHSESLTADVRIMGSDGCCVGCYTVIPTSGNLIWVDQNASTVTVGYKGGNTFTLNKGATYYMVIIVSGVNTTNMKFTLGTGSLSLDDCFAWEIIAPDCDCTGSSNTSNFCAVSPTGTCTSYEFCVTKPECGPPCHCP